MGILTVDYSERVKKIEEENTMLQDKLKRRNTQIADLKARLKEARKEITLHIQEHAEHHKED